MLLMSVPWAKRLSGRADVYGFPVTNGPLMLLHPNRAGVPVYGQPRPTVVMMQPPVTPLPPPPAPPRRPVAPLEIEYRNSEQSCENVCGDGEGDPITVTIAANDPRFTSSVSQAAANAAALAAACEEAEALREENPCTSSPNLSINFASEARAGTLCGISEYVDPSVPPKKYRVQTLSGGNCDNDYRSGPSGIPNQCTEINSGTHANGSVDNYSGTYSYDAVTCIVTNTQQNLFKIGKNCPPGDTVIPNIALDFVPLGCATPLTVFDPPWGPTISIVATQTRVDYNYNGTCIVLEGQDAFGFPLYTGRIVVGITRKELSVEDTEDDAYARGTVTPGTSNVASNKLRGAGDFAVAETVVAFDIEINGLEDGLNYRVTVPTVTEDYGGGSPVSGSLIYDFTASGTSENISDVVNADPGKQVTIGTPTIAVI